MNNKLQYNLHRWEGLPVLDLKKIGIGNYPLHSDAIR